MKTISVLGSGWLGKPLAEQLLAAGNQVNISTRDPDKVSSLKDAGLLAHRVDIEQLTSTVGPFLQASTLIINITSKDKSAYQALAKAIEKSPIKQVLFISSTSVYGSQQGLCQESAVLDNETNLRQIERLFMDNAQYQCTVIRFAGLIGPKRHPGRFFASGKSIKDSTAKVNLIHQADCLKLINTVLTQQAWGDVFNGCADTHPKKADYYTEMATSLGYPAPTCLVAEQPTNKVVCNEKIKKQLGYQFVHPDLAQIPW